MSFPPSRGRFDYAANVADWLFDDPYRVTVSGQILDPRLACPIEAPGGRHPDCRLRRFSKQLEATVADESR